MTRTCRNRKAPGHRLLASAFLLLAWSILISIAQASSEKSGTESGSPLVSIEAKVDKSVITIGDRILYTLTVISDTSVTLEPLSFGENLGQFEIKDYTTEPETIDQQGRRVNRSVFEITTFFTGEYVIPPFEVSYILPDSTRGSIASEPITVTVESVVLGELDSTADIIDIRGQYSPPSPVWPWVAAGAALLAAALGFLAYRRYRRRSPKEEQPSEPPLPPWEWAYKALHELKESDLLERGEVKLFYLRMSEIQKRYLSERFDIGTVEATTDEIRQLLRNAKLDHQIYRRYMESFENSDLVKFAKYVPPREVVERDIAEVEELVRLTTPAGQAAAEPVKQEA